MWWIFAIIFCVICGFIAGGIASNKGRSSVGWFFVGFLLDILGIIIAACVSDLNQTTQLQSQINEIRENEKKWVCVSCGCQNPLTNNFCSGCGKERVFKSGWHCPHCGKANNEDSNFCGNCGSPRPAPAIAEETKTEDQSATNNWESAGHFILSYDYISESGERLKVPSGTKVHILKKYYDNTYDLEYSQGGKLVQLKRVQEFFIMID